MEYAGEVNGGRGEVEYQRSWHGGAAVHDFGESEGMCSAVVFRLISKPWIFEKCFVLGWALCG